MRRPRGMIMLLSTIVFLIVWAVGSALILDLAYVLQVRHRTDQITRAAALAAASVVSPDTGRLPALPGPGFYGLASCSETNVSCHRALQLIRKWEQDDGSWFAPRSSGLPSPVRFTGRSIQIRHTAAGSEVTVRVTVVFREQAGYRNPFLVGTDFLSGFAGRLLTGAPLSRGPLAFTAESTVQVCDPDLPPDARDPDLTCVRVDRPSRDFFLE